MRPHHHLVHRLPDVAIEWLARTFPSVI